MWFHVVSYLYFHRNDLGIASDCSDFDGGGGCNQTQNRRRNG